MKPSQTAFQFHFSCDTNLQNIASFDANSLKTETVLIPTGIRCCRNFAELALHTETSLCETRMAVEN